MRLRDFRIGWRLMVQQPAYSLIMISGLTVAFAVCFLALAFAHYSLSYNSSVPDIDRVHVVKVRPNWGTSFWSEIAPLPMKEAMEQSGLPLKVTTVMEIDSAMRIGDVVQKVVLTVVDPDFGDVFGLLASEGDLRNALSRPHTLAIGMEAARQLFGETHVLGRTIHIDGQPYQVAAIVRDPPDNSSVKFQVLAGPDTGAWDSDSRKKARDLWSYYKDGGEGQIGNRVYVRLGRGVMPDAVEQLLTDMVERSSLRSHLTVKESAELGQRKLLQIALGPLADSYMDQEARFNSGPKGSLTATIGILAAAGLLLLLTGGNYVSLATIHTIQRQREIAIRKVLGMSAARLVGQMMTESLLASMLAAVLGMLLAWLLLPAWCDLTGYKMASILDTRDWARFVLAGLVMGAVVGVAGGLYPGWTALKLRMLDSLGGRGNDETIGSLWLRRMLTVMQFAIAMFVTGMIITIAWQIQFLKQIDYGYQIDSLLTLRFPTELAHTEIESFRERVARLPGIYGAAGMTTIPSDMEVDAGNGQVASLPVLAVGPEYFNVIGLPAVAGRLFNPNIDNRENASGIVINQAAAQRLGYAQPASAVGRLVSLKGKPAHIVGVSKDVRNGFMHGPTRPRIYAIAPTTRELAIHGGRDLRAAQIAIEQFWRSRFPNSYLDLRRARADLELNAGGPIEILTTCILVACIVIPLAVFSIYVLSAHMVRRRSREIVIRKLYGAQRADIARLLVREFAILLGIAAIVGLPLAYVIGRIFMEQFADQASIGLWSTAGSLLGAGLVTALATARHTLAATRISPATVLRVV